MPRRNNNNSRQNNYSGNSRRNNANSEQYISNRECHRIVDELCRQQSQGDYHAYLYLKEKFYND